MQNSSCRILSYRIRHNYNVGEFLLSYRSLQQRAVDEIWDKIEWRRKGKRLIPIIPRSREFKRNLRSELLRNWSYAAHYVDSAIRTAYSILNSWRRNYLKGKRGRNKPVVKGKFVRVKETLYTFRDGKIRVTIEPGRTYLEFDLSKAWFKKRVKGCELGELILKESELIITFRGELKPKPKPEKRIAWDLNLLSMDGFCEEGWVKVDLKPLYTLHVAYENRRRRIQKMGETRRTARKLMQKYSRRYRNRVKDFLHKLTAKLSREFGDYEHGFEDLDKHGMFNGRKVHNREVARQNWKQIIFLMSYKARVRLLDPRNSTRTCPRCGGRAKLRKGRVECGCGLVLDRQLSASINLYLRMWGFPPSVRVWEEKILPILRGSGVTLNGCETDDTPSMNPEGAEVDVHQGLGRGTSTNFYQPLPSLNPIPPRYLWR